MHMSKPPDCTCLSKGTGANHKVGACTADEAQHIVRGLQVVPEADVLMVEDVIRPVHTSEHLYSIHCRVILGLLLEATQTSQMLEHC